MRVLRCVVALLALTAFVAVAAEGDKETPKEVIINIVGGGADAKYIKEGDDEQKAVAVTVGQKVTWKNKGAFPHTATSKKKGDKGPLFDTKRLKKGESKSIEFDTKLYEAAGGKDGKEVELEYFCEIHGEEMMKSSLKLKPAEKKDK
jgi:plastocyanin